MKKKIKKPKIIKWTCADSKGWLYVDTAAAFGEMNFGAYPKDLRRISKWLLEAAQWMENNKPSRSEE